MAIPLTRQLCHRTPGESNVPWHSGRSPCEFVDGQLHVLHEMLRFVEDVYMLRVQECVFSSSITGSPTEPMAKASWCRSLKMSPTPKNLEHLRTLTVNPSIRPLFIQNGKIHRYGQDLPRPAWVGDRPTMRWRNDWWRGGEVGGWRGGPSGGMEEIMRH